jgi:spermidine dehydrogenase
MPWSTDDIRLGMHRAISRRDFLNGAAVLGAAAALPLGARPSLAQGSPYPPALTGLRGQTDADFAVMHAIRDGSFWDTAGTPTATGEHYDLVVVGAGISGLAAAVLYRQQKPGARVLVLDNTDDFGGHAVRNEFTASNGRLVIGYGGSESLQTPSFFTPAVSKLLTDVGIDVEALGRAYDQQWAEDRGLGEGVFTAREAFGADALVVYGDDDAEWIAKTTLSDKAKADLLALYEAPTDPFESKSRDEKFAALADLTYAAFLTDTLGLDPQLVEFFDNWTKPYFGAGVRAVSCLDARVVECPGFDAMDLGDDVWPTMSPSGRLVAKGPDPYIFHFPDGNASVARALVRALIPSAVAGTTMEELVLARTDYGALDRPENEVRIRLQSPCVKIRNTDGGVEATYARLTNGTASLSTVTADHAVLACWHRVIPLICEEAPPEQQDALADQQKIPFLYANVLVRSWEALSKLGVAEFEAPGHFWEHCKIDYPVSIGAYRFADVPSDPVVLHLTKTVLGDPTLPTREQAQTGRYLLTEISFEEMERRLRDLLARALGPGGFDPARDIEAITVNRWSHGYSYEYMRPWDGYWPAGPLPIETSRRPIGRIAIANSDAGAYAYANSAIDQATRAVRELIGTPADAPAFATFPGPPLKDIGL